MSDQFSEWDEFYARYKRAQRMDRELRRYLRPEELNPKRRLNHQEKAMLEYRRRANQRRLQELRARARYLALSTLVSEASRSTTSGSQEKDGSRLQLSNKSLDTPASYPAEESSEMKTSSG